MRLKNKSTASANFAKKSKSESTSHGNCTNTNKKSTEDLDQKEKCKTYGDNHKDDCWHLTAKCFQCHETDYISANCPNNEEKKVSTSSCSSNHKSTISKSLTPKGKGKKMNCFSQKGALKQQLKQALASFSITFCQQQPLITLVIINFVATNHFFANRDLIINFRKYQHVFKAGLGKQIIAYSYGNVIL